MTNQTHRNPVDRRAYCLPIPHGRNPKHYAPEYTIFVAKTLAWCGDDERGFACFGPDHSEPTARQRLALLLKIERRNKRYAPTDSGRTRMQRLREIDRLRMEIERGGDENKRWN